MSAPNHDRTHKVMLFMPDLSCLFNASDALRHPGSALRHIYEFMPHVWRLMAARKYSRPPHSAAKHILIKGPVSACNIALSFLPNTFLLSVSSSEGGWPVKPGQGCFRGNELSRI